MSKKEKELFKHYNELYFDTKLKKKIGDFKNIQTLVDSYKFVHKFESKKAKFFSQYNSLIEDHYFPLYKSFAGKKSPLEILDLSYQKKLNKYLTDETQDFNSLSVEYLSKHLKSALDKNRKNKYEQEFLSIVKDEDQLNNYLLKLDIFSKCKQEKILLLTFLMADKDDDSVTKITSNKLITIDNIFKLMVKNQVSFELVEKCKNLLEDMSNKNSIKLNLASLDLINVYIEKSKLNSSTLKVQLNKKKVL